MHKAPVYFRRGSWFNGCSCLTQANGEMAFGPDAEVKDQVVVELLQKWAVALSQNLIQQQLTCKQNIHVHHTAWNLQQKRPRVISHVLCSSIVPFFCMYLCRGYF